MTARSVSKRRKRFSLYRGAVWLVHEVLTLLVIAAAAALILYNFYLVINFLLTYHKQ